MKSIIELLHNSRVVQMQTTDEYGEESVRWMTLYRRTSSPENEFWFATSSFSRKIVHIEKNPLVKIIVLNPLHHKTELVEALAEIVDDFGIKQELWVPQWDMFFPKGVESQDLILIKISIIEKNV